MSFSSGSASNMDTTSIYDDDTAIKLDLCMNFPTLEVKDHYTVFKPEGSDNRARQITADFIRLLYYNQKHPPG